MGWVGGGGGEVYWVHEKRLEKEELEEIKICRQECIIKKRGKSSGDKEGDLEMANLGE